MGKNLPKVTIEELDFDDIVKKLKEQDIYCNINQVTIKIGVTRPAADGQYSSNRTDIELGCTIAIDATEGNAKEKLDTVVNALVALSGIKVKSMSKALQ